MAQIYIILVVQYGDVILGHGVWRTMTLEGYDPWKAMTPHSMRVIAIRDTTTYDYTLVDS